MSLLHSIMRLKWTRWFGERHVSPRLCGRVHVFPGNSIGPFYISRHLINWPCVTIWWGEVFRGCTSGNFCDRYKYVCVCVQRGLKFFSLSPNSSSLFPRIERVSNRVCARFYNVSLRFIRSILLLSILIRKFFKELWSDDSSKRFENRYFYFN